MRCSNAIDDMAAYSPIRLYIFIERWAMVNNLNLNKNKSQEIIVFPSERSRNKSPTVPTLPEIERVTTLKILGVDFSHNLSVTHHVTRVCQTSAQSLYAIKKLVAHGMDSQSVKLICQATIITRLTYASPAWWGFASADDKLRLQAVLNRAVKWGYYGRNDPDIVYICGKKEDKLFAAVLANSQHVLHQFLPEEKKITYNLRPRTHCRTLPSKTNTLICKNFITRLLYKSLQ